jgi:sugar phosphate isomerase/epimerase
MKLAFRTGGFGSWKMDRILEELRGIGYSGVELCLEHSEHRPEKMNADLIQRTRQQLDRLGLGIASASYHADGEDMATRLPNTFRAIDIAADLGTDILVVNAERAKPETKKPQFEQVVERFKKLCEQAEKRRVTLAVEPEPGLIINDTPDMLELMRRVGSKRLAVNLDVGHAVCVGESLPATIRTLGKAIVHTHLEDIAARVHKHLLPGDGDINFAAMFQAFDEIGYNGYYTVDLFAISDNPSGWARSALERLRLYDKAD